MSLGNMIRAATTGAPRLYAAARGSGASHRDSLEMVAVSAAALVVAARRHPGEWRQQNAVRHFAWQALLTARYGLDAATALAHAQEARSTDAADSAVDRANNAAGRQYAVTHPAGLRGAGTWAALTRLAAVAEAQWAAGRLSGRRPPGG